MTDVYAKLAEHLNYPNSSYLMKILQQLMTPEEGKLVADFALAGAKLGTNEESTKNAFHDLWRRGVVKAIPNGYSFHPHVFELYDYSTGIFYDPVVRQLWKDWYEAEWARDVAEQIVRNPPLVPYNTIVPNAQSLDAFSKVSNEPVLPDEDPRKIVEKVDLIAVRECVCRTMHNNCDHPRNVCLQFNEFADNDIRRSFGRKASVDETIAILNLSAEAGLCHNYNGYPEIHSICNCCVCACVPLNSVSRYRGTMDGVFTKSRYEAVVDDPECTGCQSCIDHCNFDAIDMAKAPGSKKYKAQVDSEKCMGCGACYTACEQEAISLKLVRPLINIPEDSTGIKNKLC